MGALNLLYFILMVAAVSRNGLFNYQSDTMKSWNNGKLKTKTIGKPYVKQLINKHFWEIVISQLFKHMSPIMS